jgi:type VI secretion system secreted protein VgrG
MPLTGWFLHEKLPAAALVGRMRFEEGLSVLFDGTIDFLLEDANVDLAPLLWSGALVQIYDADRDPKDPANARFFHGIVEEIEYVAPYRPATDAQEGDLHVYRARLRPRLHGLSYRIRSRIFQDVSPIDAIKKVLEGAGVESDAIEWRLSGAPPPREYITQFKESEAAFVLRWLEELGIHFWFEHSETGHVMIVSDGPDTHDPVPVASRFPVAEFEWDAHQREALREVVFGTEFGFDSYGNRDWNWNTPDSPRGAQMGEGGFERYEFPGRFSDDTEAKAIADARVLELLVPRYELRCLTNSRRMESGRTFSVTEAFPEGLIGDYLITKTVHTYSNAELRQETDPASGSFYSVRVRSIPVSRPFYPPRVTPRPSVHGKESAVVTGPAGEEIHVDAMGRIKVHFYWDREQPVDDTASVWMRFQQLNAASVMILPRVGWEVDVGFLYGDPDRPVVLQKLYNKEQVPPYALPGSLMKNSLQSSSSPGGGGTNEIRTDDTKGKQEFFMHAQKDLAITVGNNRTEKIGVDSTLQVGVDHTHKVGGSETITIGGSQSLSITGASAHDVVAARTVTVGGLDDWGVGKVHSVTTEGSRSDTIGGVMVVLAVSIAETFNATHDLSVGGALAIAAGGPFVETTAGKKTELVGAAKAEIITQAKAENIGAAKNLTSGAFKVDAGTDVNIAAGGALGMVIGGAMSSKAGGAFGISGSSVTVKCASLSLKAGSKITASGGSIKLKGSKVGGTGGDTKLTGTVKYK